MTKEEITAENKRKALTLMSLSDFVSWLNSMTTTELHETFPGSFHKLSAADGAEGTVTNMLANDAIMWRFAKDYNKFLLQKVRKEMLIGEKPLIKDFKYSFGGDHSGKLLHLVEISEMRVYELLQYADPDPTVDVELIVCPVK